MSDALSETADNNHCGRRDNFFDDLIRRKQTLDKGNTSEEAQECFQFFDEDRDGILNTHEFHQLCYQLLSHPDCKQEWTEQDTSRILGLLNKDGGHVNEAKFHTCWESWIKPILKPTSALVLVDVQNDFISGSLAVENGDEVVPVINRLLETVQFDEVVYSYDYHPENHISFYKNRRMRRFHTSSSISAETANVFDTVMFDGHNSKPIEQKLWPTHCVQKSTGAELHKDLKLVQSHFKAYKGTNPEQESYSVFHPTQEPNNNTMGPALATRLRQQGITDLFICGLALDFCVAFTALDASRMGFRTIVVEDACRGLAEENICRMKTNMEEAGCVFVTSNEVADMVSGYYRHPKLSFASPLNNSTN